MERKFQPPKDHTQIFACIESRFSENNFKKWYFVTKIVLTYYEKKFSSDREKLLKFEAEGREFEKF